MTSAERDWLESLQGSGIRPGLGRVRALLRTLGHPERRYRSIIVAGTNGKGSTSATLASILDASGYRTGLYTSPHLVDIRERWRIGREPIEESVLDECITVMQAASERIGISPTYFEALTVLAFIAFAKTEREIAVLEVGMGGRLDATNVVRPIAAVISPIAFDHTEFLGKTLRKIAMEKAGVIHRGAVVVTSNTEDPILSVLRKRAEKFGNAFHVVDADSDLPSPLVGDFQRRNVALAVRAAEELRPMLPKITPESIARGVADTDWPGRLHLLRVRGKDVWIDGCHNVQAAAAVTPHIITHVERPRVLLLGVMSDKDVQAIARILIPLFDRVVTTEPYPPRSESAGALSELASSMGVESAAEPDPATALERALSGNERSVFVGGSLYLAGAVLGALSRLEAGSDR